MTITQMKKDWSYFDSTYIACEDMCSDVCNTELFIGLLKGTTSKEQCYIAIVQRYYDTGTTEGTIPETDKKAQRIFKRWLKEGLID